MTPTQTYGRTQALIDDLEAPPEEWQFENAKPVKIRGRKKIDVPKLNLDAILPKGDKEMKFTELSEDKQLKLVAEEYNKDVSISGMCKKFGIGPGPLYKHIHAAKEAGLIPIMRAERKAAPEPQAEVVEVEEKQEVVLDGGAIKPATVTQADFDWAIESKRSLADKLERDAERLERASVIAADLTELLGDEAGDLINSLYVRVS